MTLGADSVNADPLKWDDSMRVIFAALALSALSFVAGVAGDLSEKPGNSGVAVTVRIPPPIPADAPRARPLVSTTAAAAAERPRPEALEEEAAPAHEAAAPAKRRMERVLRVTAPKRDARLAEKARPVKGA